LLECLKRFVGEPDERAMPLTTEEDKESLGHGDDILGRSRSGGTTIWMTFSR